MTGNPHGPADSGELDESPYAVRFHPDTGRLLDLLASEAVYGTPLAAVRELVLNAFDAVREGLIRQRLLLPAAEHAADPKWETVFQQQEQVTVEGFRNDNGIFLTCLDTGIGMNAEIIASQLLCPGKPPGPVRQELDRQCQVRGFRACGRIRRGLGFLSYFMLADAVKIRSRRVPPHGGIPERGVIFKSDGPRGRTVLRSLPNHQKGPANTRVTLRLHENKSGSLADFEGALRAYLQQTVVRTPCAIRVLMETGGLDFPAGWSPGPRPCVSAHVLSPWPHPLGLKRLPVTSATLDLITALRSIPAENLAQSGVRIESDALEFHIPGLASLRCTAPWISYRGTRAMIWATDADPAADGGLTLVDLRHDTRTAWQGMHCRITGGDLPGLKTARSGIPQGESASLPPWGYLALDVDLDEPPVATLSLDRTSVELTPDTHRLLRVFCLTSLHHMAGHVRKRHPGTLLAEQMEEVEQRLRILKGA